MKPIYEGATLLLQNEQTNGRASERTNFISVSNVLSSTANGGHWLEIKEVNETAGKTFPHTRYAIHNKLQIKKKINFN